MAGLALSVGTAEVEVPRNAACWGHHVPRSAWRLPGTPCATLACGSGDGGLAVTRGWLHVPHTVSFCSSEMTARPGCDHLPCSATRWGQKSILGGGTLVPVTVNTSPLVPPGLRNSDQPLVQLSQNRYSPHRSHALADCMRSSVNPSATSRSKRALARLVSALYKATLTSDRLSPG